jgi:uncharacterized membrane protein YqjE
LEVCSGFEVPTPPQITGRNPAGHAGLIDNAISFFSAFFAYVETHAALLASESKAALLKLVTVVAFGLGALIAVVFGYIFVLVSLVVGIAHRTGIFWIWIALITGLLHIGVAAVCVFLAKSTLRSRLYAETRVELKRDQAWLKTLGKTEQQ